VTTAAVKILQVCPWFVGGGLAKLDIAKSNEPAAYSAD
jgi:hypothetical protein